MKQIITSLDIGSDKIKLIVSEAHNDELFVLACSEVTSKGIKKGFIVSPEEAVVSIKEVFKRVSEVLGTKIDNVILTVPSYGAEFIKSEGYTTINRESMRVTGDDVVRAMQACVYNKITPNKELINIMPVEYIINDSEVVSDPKGKEANKLTVNSILSLAPKKNVYGIVSLLESLGVGVSDICFGSLADYYTYKTPEMNDKLVGVINIGYYKTEVSIINNGILVGSSVVDLGGRNVDRDISYVYDIVRKDASKIKEKFSLAHINHASTSETVEVLTKHGEHIKINQYEVSGIVYERLKEILELAKKEINILTRKEVCYIIITGGSTEVEDFKLLMDEVMPHSILGSIRTLGIRNNKYSSALGVAKYYKDKLNFRNKLATTMSEEKQNEMFQVKKKFNSNILGKIYGYFFDN